MHIKHESGPPKAMQPLIFPGVFILNCFLLHSIGGTRSVLTENIPCTCTDPVALVVPKMQ